MRVNLGPLVHVWARRRLTSKILLVFVPLLVVALLVVGAVAIRALSGLGDSAVVSTLTFGNAAISDASGALTSQAREQLQRMAADQAALSDAFFGRVGGETDTLARYAGRLWAASSLPEPRPLYPPDVAPSDPLAASVYVAAPSADPERVAREVVLTSAMEDLFIPLRANDPHLTWVYVATEGGLLQWYPWNDGVPPGFDPRVRPWYGAALRSDRVVWSEPYVDAGGAGLVVTASRRFLGPDGRPAGVAGADIAINVLNEQMGGARIGERGYAFAVDGTGRVIARPGLTAGDVRWDEAFASENLLQGGPPLMRRVVAAMTAGGTGVETVSLDDGDRFVAFAPIPSTGWSVGIVLPVQDVLASAMRAERDLARSIQDTEGRMHHTILGVTQEFAVLVFAVLSIACAATIGLSRTITRRLRVLGSAAAALEAGQMDEAHLQSLQQGQGEDEVASLVRLFARMAAEVRAREEELRRQVRDLHIEIDQTKRARQVAEITETDYFQDLQRRTRELRRRSGHTAAPDQTPTP